MCRIRSIRSPPCTSHPTSSPFNNPRSTDYQATKARPRKQKLFLVENEDLQVRNDGRWISSGRSSSWSVQQSFSLVDQPTDPTPPPLPSLALRDSKRKSSLLSSLCVLVGQRGDLEGRPLLEGDGRDGGDEGRGLLLFLFPFPLLRLFLQLHDFLGPKSPPSPFLPPPSFLYAAAAAKQRSFSPLLLLFLLLLRETLGVWGLAFVGKKKKKEDVWRWRLDEEASCSSYAPLGQ